MTRFELIEAIRQDFPAANQGEILRVTNDLEHRLYKEVFEPAGQSSSAKPDDLHVALLASQGHSTLYVAYVSAFFATQDGDYTRANAYSELFNQGFSELAAEVRRTHPVARKTRLTGGDLF